MRYSFYLLLLFIISVTTVPVVNAASPEPVVMILGDSLSAAPGVPVQSNWAHLLQQRLQEKGYSYKVVNASVSGDTTTAGLARLPTALKTHQPQIVIIALGGNDGLQGLPTTEMHKNINRMITLAKSADAKVLLCGVRLPPNLGQAYVSKFLEVYHVAAKENNVPVVPYILKNIATHPELMLADGIHPNERGQPIVLENVWAGLRTLL
jgi:acyl-CoA thioesterase-1